MTSDHETGAVDLHRLRRSCSDCSLRTLCLPAGVNLDELDALDELVRRPSPIDRNAPLFRAGAAFEALYVVRSGSLKTLQVAGDGGQQVMGFHLPGEVLGLDAIHDDTHQCDAIALERTSVCAVPMAHLEQAAARLPSLQRQLHRIMSREMLHDQEHMAALGRRSARARMALFLYNLSRRLSESGHSGTTFYLSMSRADIASYLGLALETVSRLLSQLAEERLVSLDRRRIHLLDPDGLARIAGTGDGGNQAAQQR